MTPSAPEQTGRRIMYREALNEALREEMLRDERVFLIGGGIAGRGGSYKVTAGLLDQFGPRRVIDAPISESSFTGMGVGAAITGMRPVVEILFVDFTSLIIDQIVNQATGSFTVTNLGMFGVDTFVPVINPPEAAILAIGAVTRKPTVVGDQIVPRERMTLVLACDHRTIDGTYAAQFLDMVRQQLENPTAWEG